LLLKDEAGKKKPAVPIFLAIGRYLLIRLSCTTTSATLKEMEDILDWMVLGRIPGIGVTGFWTLVERFGSPGAVLQCPLPQLQAAVNMRKNQLTGLVQKNEMLLQCRRELDELRQKGIECIIPTDDRYPPKLKEISDPPVLLYVVGNVHLLKKCCIAVVGSRASTSYGSRVAHTLASRLSACGVTVVSGLALGIDTEAHRGALAAGGNTVAVLGCGLDVIYPRQNRQLFEKIAANGAIVSEYPLGTAPEGFRFPARNRIIAGLSSGVVVVEAARKSGSLITAQLAIDEGRDVYAVPGQVDSYKSEGTHWLLQQGAKLVQSEKDILEDLGEDARVPAAQTAQSKKFTPSPSLERKAEILLRSIDSYPLPRDELIRRSGLEIYEFSEFLLLLELEGLVEVLPGDEIRRIP
jgi:DNA processing protein